MRSSPLATFLAKITIYEGKEAEFEDVARMMYAATHGNEPKCRRYEYWRGAEPRSYYCLESFDDFLAFMDHQTSDHHEAPDFGSLLESIELEWVDPIEGAADLVPTEAQELPADADDLTRRYAESHPVLVQAWWKALRIT